MGMLIEGKWRTDDLRPSDDQGRFVRRETSFRHQVTADGSSGYPAEPGRYHLYVSLACPWAHRTLIVRKLRRLEDVISLSVVHWHMGDLGWEFAPDPAVAPGTIPDTVNGRRYLHEVYQQADPRYTGRVTVPALWDKHSGTLVNNESREIVRMLDTAFAGLGDPAVNFAPPELRGRIDEAIDAIYQPINNGVYRAGFAKRQAAYDEAVTELFDALQHWERVLGRQRYLCGERITEADWCLFTTLVRFDPVYHGHFKCNLHRLVDYPNLWNYLKELYQVPGVADTVSFEHIKRHYYESHRSVNPSGIVPRGPLLDLNEPHDRARRFAA